MMNTSAIKEEQQDLISILTTELEKEKKDSISILTTLLEQKKSQLKELQSIPTKISRALDTLMPITTEYPEYKKAIASQLGLILPPPQKSRVIEIEIDESEGSNHQTKEKQHITPTNENITEVSSNPPSGKVDNKTESNNSSKCNAPTHPTSDTLVAKLEELAQVGLQHNLTININTEELTGYVLAPHPQTEKLHRVITFNITELPNNGWLWEYDINVNSVTYKNIHYTGSPADFAQVLKRGATYYFKEPLLTLLTKLTEDYLKDWADGQVVNHQWTKTLTEKESEQLMQTTDTFSGTIPLLSGFYQWNFNTKSKILTLEKNNNDTTSDNNGETDSTYIDKSGDVPTPPTSDTDDISDRTNNITITWYKSNSGEVGVGSEKRYFQILWNHVKEEHDIKFKKSTDSKKWIKANNYITQLFAEAIAQELKAGKNHEAEALLEKLCEAAKEVGGKFVGTGTGDVGTLGYFEVPHENIEVGCNDSSWWFIRPGRNKVYCSGDVNGFAKVLKGLKTDVVLESQKSQNSITPQLKTAAITKIETAEPNQTQDTSEIGNIIRKFTSTFPDGWKQETRTNLQGEAVKWRKILTETETEQILHTNVFQGLIELNTRLYNWHLLKNSRILTLQEKDTTEIVDVANNPTVTWYNSNTGEITINQEKRFFQILWNSKKNEYQVGLKKSLSSQKWRKDKNPTAQKFVDAIMQEFKENKPDPTNAKVEETTENNTGNTSDCWYTPPQIVELVEEVLGKIDLDPCADDKKHIPAKYHKTIKEDGLGCVWYGKVFINPPYSCPGKWIEKLISEVDSGNVTEAIALLPASTDTKWFQPLWSQPICFWKGRIKFLDINYQPKSPARQSHCLVYWGENIDKFSQVFNKYGEITLPTKTKQEILTLSETIKPYLPPTWILEEHSFDKVILQEKHHENNHVQLIDCLNGDIRITHNIELLYIVQSQDIETAIDLIYSWFEQQKSVKTPSITNNNSSNQVESTVAGKSQEEDKKLLTLTEQIKPILLEDWELETINDNEVILYETQDKNRDWVQITETSDSSTHFILTHKGESYFSNNISDIKFALVSDNFTDINWEILSAKDRCDSIKSTESFKPKEEVNADSYELDIDYLDRFIEIINNYNTDLTILRKDTSTACIQICKKTVGTIFLKDDQTIEIAEREKQLLTESYSIDTYDIIKDIYQEKVDKNPNNYLMGVGILDAEFSNLDTLQNALHCLSNQLNLLTIRQGKTFKVYNGKGWLENYLGSVKVNDSKIISDEKLSYELLNNYSILLNQLTSDIATGETEIETDNYMVNSGTLKELLTKENWSEEDFETANNLLNELVIYSPCWYELSQIIRHKRKELIEQTNENDEDNLDNNGGSKTPPSTPKNPNNNGGIKHEFNTENLDTLETAINSYKTELQLDKNCSQIAFYQGHLPLGSVTINQGKLLAESKLVSNLTVFYGINIKGLIKSIKYNSKHPSHDVDPFAYIGSNNNALKPRGCVVAPTWEKGRERRGILHSVSGEIATIQWLDSGVPGDNGIGYVNINLLRYVSAQPLTKSDSNQVSTVSVESENMDTDKPTKCDSDEPTAESIASLNFGGLIETQTTTPTNTTSTVVEANHTPSEQRETGKSLTINSQNLTINGKAISFGKTLTELLSGNKTVTRRFWKDNYAKRFIDDWNAKPGEFLYPALTKGYHVGGKRVGYIRLTHKPYQEKLVHMPSAELAAEGFPKLSKEQFIANFFEGDNQQIVWVIRFEFIPNKENPESLSEQKKTKTSLEEKLINKIEAELSLIDKFEFERTLGIPKITLHISLKDEILGRIFTDSHEGLVSDIPLEESLMERYKLDIKSFILDVVKGKQLQIENYRKQPENSTTTKGDTEIIEDTAYNFFDDWDDPTWIDLIKASIEKLEGFKVTHDEVDLTITHYGTYIGSIHHNQDDELEIEQKLIGELAKYDWDLEAFLVAENIPYKVVSTKPVVVTPNQTSEHIKKSEHGSSNGNKTDSNVLNKNETELDTIYIQEPCTITKIRQILATVAPEICLTDDGINMVAWRDGKDLGSINVPALPLWITYSSNLEKYLKNDCGFNLSSLIEDIEKGNLNGLPFSDLIKELKNSNQNCKYFDSDKKNNLPVTSQNQGQAAIELDLLDQLATVFDSFDNIHTKRSETTLWFYRGDENLYPCLMQTRDGKTFTLFPTVKLKSNMKELFGIDIDQLCFDLEAGKSLDINDYVDNSVWEKTIKDSNKNNETITWSDILNNAAINDTTDSQTSDELNASTTTEESNADIDQHPEGLHWVKDTSIYNRSETYIVWNGTQKCGKIHICNKSKNKAGFGKWYVSPNVIGPYYDTIEKAATACWEDFISKHSEQTESEEELIPF